MSGIICWACLILTISVLWYALLQWRSEFNKNQQKHESQQNQDLWWILLRGCHRLCRLQLHQARGRHGTDIKTWEICCGKLSIKASWWTLPNRLFKIGLWSFLVFSKVEKWGFGAQSIGKPDKTSWNAVQQICPHHGHAFHDGNAHSVKYGELIHDGSAQPDTAYSQEKQIPTLSSWEMRQQNFWIK